MTRPIPPVGVRRALLIGINSYQERPLAGCVTDATAMAELLRDRFAFDEANITLLLERDASKERVEAEMARVLDVTQPDDTFCFFYAGHGTLFEQDELTEGTGFGSTFCLSEEPREDIYDFQFGRWLDQLATRTQNVVLLIDCCHSGTITRDGALPPRVRQTSGPPRSARPADRPAGTGRRIARPASSEHVMIAACRDDQLASETWLDDTRTSTTGALSKALRRELRAARSGDTWRDIFERLEKQVSSDAKAMDGYQTPVIEGRQDRTLFDLAELPPLSPVRVTERSGDAVLLNAGALHGVTKGLVYTMHPASAKDGDTPPLLGRVQVVQVRGTTARAQIVDEAEPNAITVGAHAVSSTTDSLAMALAIENSAATNPLRDQITVTLLLRNSSGTFDEATGDMPEIASGSRVGLRITSAATHPVFVYPFYFSPRQTITSLTKNGLRQLDPGKTLEFGVTPPQKLTVTLTGNVTSAEAHYKIFVTEQPTDLSYLEQLGEVARDGDAEPPGAALAKTDRWIAVTKSVRVHATTELESGAKVRVQGATVQATGVKATLTPLPPRVVRTDTRDGDGDSLFAALAAEGLTPQQSFELTNAELSGDGTRGDSADPTLTLEVPDAGDGMAQVVVTTDDDGLVRWHFAAPENSRDGTPSALRNRTFVIPLTPTPSDGDRSILASIGKKLIEVYLFPVGKAVVGAVLMKYAHDLELRRVPYRVRSFTPDDYTSKDGATVIEGDAWKTLTGGPALLMIHGTTSNSHSAFAALPRDFVAALHQQYKGRVFAFDHPTLTHTPTENVETLFRAMPEGTTLEVDIVCHSRGGLVSRVLAERQELIQVKGRTVKVRKVIFVGSPNAGTRLCEENFLTAYLDSLTNQIEKITVPSKVDLFAGVAMFAKIAVAGTYTALTGIHCMQPGGAYAAWLNDGTRQEGTRYYALTSNFKPSAGSLWRLCKYVLAERVFDGAHNDLVVPTDSVFSENGSSAFPITDRVMFDGTDGIPHTGFFGEPRVTTQIATWLQD